MPDRRRSMRIKGLANVGMRCAVVAALACGSLALLPAAGAQAYKVSCPTGGKGPVTLSVIYGVDTCVRENVGYISSVVSHQSTQGCGQEAPGDAALTAQGITIPATESQTYIAAAIPQVEAYVLAERRWYAKHKKWKTAKQTAMAKKIVKALDAIGPLVAPVAVAESAFTSDMLQAASAWTTQNCAQLQMSLSQAAVAEGAVGLSEHGVEPGKGALGKYVDAIQAFVTILT